MVKKKLLSINKHVMKEKTKNLYRNLLEEEKEAKREYSGRKYRNMKVNANAKRVKGMQY